MRISDWSSDVCSSDLGRSGWSRRGPPSGVPRQGQAGRAAREDAPTEEGALECVVAVHAAATEPGDLAGGVQALDRSPVRAEDRKSVGEGRSVAVSVDPGVRRIMKQKKQITSIS